MRSKSFRGFVLVEAVGSMMLGLLAIAYQLEILRSAQYHVLFQYEAFLYARERALGVSEWASRHRARDRFLRWLPEGERVMRAAERGAVRTPGVGVESYLRYRYPGLLGILRPLERFQVTKRCLFSSF